MPDSESAFWQFSLRFYRRPEVPPLCLALQDQQGIDVNLLFLLCFFSTHGRALTADEVRRIDNTISPWRTSVVQPLRALRRELKNGIAPIDAQTTQDFRNAIKRDELQAERLQQEAMERAFPLHAVGKSAAPREAAATNMAAYAAVVGALPQATLNALLASLIEEFSL